MRLLQELGFLKRQPTMILAARAYYEGMSGISDHVEAHFAGVPLPGYGWVFPTSPTGANVGLGFWQTSVPWRRMPASPRFAMDEFLRHPKLAPRLAGAEQLGPIKSYPLRIDFASAPTHAERILLVGETAGLVSPLTGEGIDFALESGQIAASFLVDAFARGDFALEGYDRLLRREFQSIFRFLDYARRFYINPLLMGRTIAVAKHRPELKRMLVNVLMSQQHPSGLITPNVVRRVLLGA
jgi:flavin-dependent dehydrogenase